MARVLRTNVRKKTVRLAVGGTSLGVAAAMMLAVASSGTAFADTVLPGGTGSYNVAASSAGLYLALAGHQLTGGTSQVSGTYSYTGTGDATESASAQAQGFLLSTSLTGTGPSVSVKSPQSAPSNTVSGTEGKNGDPAANGGTGGSNADVGGPATPPDCNQGGGQLQSGVGLFVGLGCGYATATIDPTGTAASSLAGPQALGAANIAQVTVSLDGILSQVYSGGASQLCSGLGSVPTLGPVLQTACNQVLTGLQNPPTGTLPLVNPTVQVDVGNAYSQIVSNSNLVAAIAHSNSIDVSVFPGLNSGLPPLLRVEIPAAIAVSCEGTGNVKVGGASYPCNTPPSNACTSSSTTGWTNYYEASIIRITGTLIDALSTASSGGFPDPLEILSCSQLASANSGLQQAEQAGLGQLLTLNLASATTSGSGVSGSGLEVELLPGKGPGGSSVVSLNGAGINTTATGSASGTPPTSPAQQQSSSPLGTTQAPTVAAATSPTAVHTGEWWAGSLPLLAVLAALGGGLLGWPRLRRFPVVAHLVDRVTH
jgi:hypothetical protein